MEIGPSFDDTLDFRHLISGSVLLVSMIHTWPGLAGPFP